MKNRELFSKDPQKNDLVNNGVAAVTDGHTPEELRTLRHELETFVCDGQYAKGLSRILSTYIRNLEKPEQPAVWVSGFFGSGKSHLVKMLRYLWVNYDFPDGATARGLAKLPQDIADQFKELTTAGKRLGGLQSAAGTLGAGSGDSVRLALLSIFFRSLGLPEEYPMARFVLWLRNRGIEDKVRKFVEKAGVDFTKEVKKMYVSPVIADALLAADSQFAKNAAEARATLRNQFPNVLDPSTENMVDAIQEALSINGKFPCTLIVLDEVQQYIGENATRTNMVQEVTEGCIKRFGSKLLFVATGQSSLTGTPQLSKLKDRFTVPVELSDADVETVIRTIVLSKKPDKVPVVQEVVTMCSGEIARHLTDTKIETRQEDQEVYVADYPLLPVRRRFWERVLRAVDRAGTTAQLRSQLKIVHESVRATADEPVGNVVAGDFIYDQVATNLLQTGVLQKEIDGVIRKQADGTPQGRLRQRLLSLIFLINKLPRDPGVDQGIRATPETLADLLVENLKEGSSQLRKQIPDLLAGLVQSSQLMQVENEYRLQTRESAAWDIDYRDRLTKLLNNDATLATERTDLLREQTLERLKGVKLVHGKSKESRKLDPYFNSEARPTGHNVPVWVRDGWTDEEKTVIAEARAASTDDATITLFLPKRDHDGLRKAIAAKKGAEQTLQVRGVPSTLEGQEARHAMETRLRDADGRLEILINDVFNGSRVFLAGGTEVDGMVLPPKVQDAAERALSRLYREFDAGDDPRWEKVIERAKKGDATALEAVDHKGDVEKNAVCSAVLQYIHTSRRGSEVRKNFAGIPYGWPQDTVDGALAVLVASSHLRATQNGQPVELKQIDRQKIGVTDFRCETVSVSTTQRLAVRKLLTDSAIPFKPGEELTAVPALLSELVRLADDAGGDPPLPARPNKTHLRDLGDLSGNELLVAIAAQRETLSKQATDWKGTAALVAKRRPRWDSLQKLLSASAGSPVQTDVTAQADAISTQRSLLANPDPVPPLCDRLAQSLRQALIDAHAQCASSYDVEMAKLTGSEVWAKLSTDQRQSILDQNDLSPVVPIRVGTEAEILSTLEARPLKEWQTLCDAIPQRFAKALNAASKQLEPKAVWVQLPKATLKTEQELDAWLATARKALVNQLKEGPVIV